MTEEIAIPVPYNSYNFLITKEDIKTLFKKYNIDVNINNINLFHIALTHKSYIISEYTNYNHNIFRLFY